MPRRARIVVVDLPHHITQRGNFSQPVFQIDKDWKKYLDWIREYSETYKLSHLAYCLMPNHVHFISIPKREDSLARTFNTAHMRYSQYSNWKSGRTGHLWQGRFFSCVMDDGHLLAAVRYVERNPVRAKLTDRPWRWKWSSAAAHTRRGSSPLPLEDLFKYVELRPSQWEAFITASEEQGVLDSIKKHTLVGRPLGSDRFLGALQKNLDITVPALRRGRPRNVKAGEA